MVNSMVSELRFSSHFNGLLELAMAFFPFERPVFPGFRAGAAELLLQLRLTLAYCVFTTGGGIACTNVPNSYFMHG